MLIVTGTIAYDFIMDFPGAFSDHILPDQLHKINLSFIVNKFAKHRGGTAGNISYSLGLLKAKQILFSYAGKDFQEYKKEFEKFGINTSNVKIDVKTHTSTGFAMTDKAANQIWGYYYGASANIPSLKLSTVAKMNDLVFIGPSGAAGSVSFIKQCIKSKLTYFFDPGFILTQATNEQITEGFVHAKYVIGNDYEISLLKDRVLNFEKEAKKRIVITTLGQDGALISDHGNEIKIKPCRAAKVVDPTGAGDAWRSGFLAGLEKGFDLKTCGQMGSVAGTFAVENYGAQEHFYTKKQFETRYFKTYNHLVNL